jgi:hypothetical protein
MAHFGVLQSVFASTLFPVLHKRFQHDVLWRYAEALPLVILLAAMTPIPIDPSSWTEIASQLLREPSTQRMGELMAQLLLASEGDFTFQPRNYPVYWGADRYPAKP